ncbi:RNA polymerase sigma factor [Nitriliruptor alkaliphilus]|uniref:RNA polymerase sigma factor n=1 Tax=Nitriliruptor alkaliphilus TaxID=427918 RepID=UPI0006985225|nr:RNA polymerase sigma factor [Nitriliruptor alkaliphilus]
MQQPGRHQPLDDLVDGVRRGDRDAIAAVYLEVAPGLRGFLLRRVRHGGVADDLVEQTFVELIEGCATIRGDGTALRAWLYRAARNNLNDWRKRADRRADHELTAQHQASLHEAGPDPGQQVVDASVDPRIVRALGQLTAEQREVVELRLVAGLPIADVAALIERTPGAVKLLQHRAVRRLASLLTEDVGPGPVTSPPSGSPTGGEAGGPDDRRP